MKGVLKCTIMILSFRTGRPGQTVQTQINFKVITTNFLGVRIFRKFTVIIYSKYFKHVSFTVSLGIFLEKFSTANHFYTSCSCGWLGRAMVLGRVLLLWHTVSRGSAVLAAGVGQVGRFFLILIFSSHLSCLPFLMPHLLGDGWTY